MAYLNRDGWITFSLPFRLCLFLDNRKARVIYISPVLMIQDRGKPNQGNIQLAWLNFGISFIYRATDTGGMAA